MTQRHAQPTKSNRTQRAATEEMEVLPVKDKWWLNIVKTQHGVYTVNAKVKTCTCRDFANRIVKLRRAGNPNAHCKHLLRVLYGQRTLQAVLLVPPREHGDSAPAGKAAA